MYRKRVGIVGYGHLGQYLVKEIQKHPDLELGFVWNRTKIILSDSLDQRYILESLEEFSSRSCDLIVEVSHPRITLQYGAAFLEHCDFMVGSPSALADCQLEETLRKGADKHGLYIPSGAFWGGQDIKRMADNGTLKKLKVTMIKHPSSFKLEGHLSEINFKVFDKATTLYNGPVRDLCPLAPNNVNTMAVAAIAAHNLGFDGVQGCLIADPNSLNWHQIEIEVTGPGTECMEFSVRTTRRNPAKVGAVTGAATFASFFSSLLSAYGNGPGVHLC